MVEKLPPYEEIRWIHRIKLPDGRVTPGQWPPFFREYGLTEVDFRGKRVLDVGCLDGQYSFYAERQGASEVVSIDINEEQFGEQRFPGREWSHGYLYAHRQLGSQARYVFPFSVYDLSAETFGQFDVVLFLGVIYHLVHPMLALERINEVLGDGGVMVLEAEVSDANTMFSHAMEHNPSAASEGSAGSQGTLPRRFFDLMRVVSPFLRMAAEKRFLSTALLKSGIKEVAPEAYASDEVYNKDLSNYWILDRTVLERLIDFSGFRIEKDFRRLPTRVSFVCTKVAPFPESLAARSKYSSLSERVTNFEPFLTRT